MNQETGICTGNHTRSTEYINFLACLTRYINRLLFVCRAWLARERFLSYHSSMVGRTRLFRWVSSWRAYWKYKRAQSKKTGDEAITIRLWLRNTVVSCGLYMLGDAFEQRVEGYGDKGANDWSRTRRMAVMGAFIGTIDTYWYSKLDKVVPGTDTNSVAKKILLDQIIWSPICCNTFFYGMSRMEGNTTSEALNEVKVKFWPTYKIDWILWPPAQAINFFLVPPKYRVVYVAFITFLWTVFLSYMKQKKIHAPEGVLKPSS